MQRRYPKLFGDLLDVYMRQEGLEMPLNEFRAEELWWEIMDDIVVKNTKEVKMQGGKLWVQIKSSALRHHLFMMRTELVQKINRAVGAQVISDIVLR